MKTDIWTPSVNIGPATTAEKLAQIIKDYSHPQIQLRVARHPNTDKTTLRKLSKHPNPEISALAKNRLAKLH